MILVRVLMTALKVFLFQSVHQPRLIKNVGTSTIRQAKNKGILLKNGPTRKVRGREIVMKDHNGCRIRINDTRNRHGSQKRRNHRLNRKMHGLQLLDMVHRRRHHLLVIAKMQTGNIASPMTDIWLHAPDSMSRKQRNGGELFSM